MHGHACMANQRKLSTGRGASGARNGQSPCQADGRGDGSLFRRRDLHHACRRKESPQWCSGYSAVHCSAVQYGTILVVPLRHFLRVLHFGEGCLCGHAWSTAQPQLVGVVNLGPWLQQRHDVGKSAVEREGGTLNASDRCLVGTRKRR